jgi:hypothetical protein
LRGAAVTAALLLLLLLLLTEMRVDRGEGGERGPACVSRRTRPRHTSKPHRGLFWYKAGA